MRDPQNKHGAAVVEMIIMPPMMPMSDPLINGNFSGGEEMNRARALYLRERNSSDKQFHAAELTENRLTLL